MSSMLEYSIDIVMFSFPYAASYKATTATTKRIKFPIIINVFFFIFSTVKLFYFVFVNIH